MRPFVHFNDVGKGHSMPCTCKIHLILISFQGHLDAGQRVDFRIQFQGSAHRALKRSGGQQMPQD